jgi:putative ABC transport system permease protein
MLRWAYRLLLLVYPADLRRELGDEIVEVFSVRLAAARARGRGAVLEVLVTEFVDSLRSGMRARRQGAAPITVDRRRRSSPHAGWRPFDALLHDLRGGLRTLHRAPGFAFAAIVVLAVAIGANAAMFSLLDAVVLRPLPFGDPDRLVSIFETNPERGWTRAQAAAANYLDWRERATGFSAIAAHNDWLIERTRVVEGRPVIVRVNEVTANFFDVLRVPMVEGRAFEPSDDWQGSAPKLVLSHAYWASQFASDPEVIGRTIVLDGQAHAVVGVAPEWMRHPFPAADGWAPVAWDPENRAAAFFRRAHGMRVIGRLAEGVDAETAGSELQAIAAQLEAEYPETNVEMGVGLMPLHEWIVGDQRPMLLLVFAAVALVLVIACVNVANLQLARATTRHGEMALRDALGAGRGRLLRLNLIESLVLAAVGGAIGVGVARAAVRGVVALLPADFPRLAGVGIDNRVLAFTAVTVVLTGLAFGLAPALRAAGRDPAGALRSVSSGGGRGRRRVAAMLVALEVALVVPVALGAVLMVRTMTSMTGVDPGFTTTDTVALGISLPRTRYADPDARGAFFAALLESLRDHEAIDAAGISTRLPFVQQRWSSDFRAESWAPDEFGVGVRHDEISRGLFTAMQVEFLEGRDFEPGELDTEPVAIVNRALAEQYFPARSPVGERLCFARATEDCRYWYRVVGVVDDVHRVSLAEREEPSIYGSVIQNGSSSGYLIVRAGLPKEDVVDLVAAAVAQFDPELPFHTVTSLGEVVAGSVARERLILVLLAAFAGIAILLAAFGIYSVVAYSTTQRTRELGIRSSLGARPAELMRSVVARGMAPVVVGVVVGVGLGMLAGRALSSFLFAVGAGDPVSYGAVVIGVLMVALLACLVPARWALRVDPIAALRTE